jgi:hypothetical protein
MIYLNFIFIYNFIYNFMSLSSFSMNKINNKLLNILSLSNSQNNNDIFKKIYKNNTNNNIENKKIISISPSGYKGIYCTGVCTYIKQNYNLDNFVFSGASSGSWNALLMCCKKDIKIFRNDILMYSLNNTETIIELEILMKKKILEIFNENDFELNKLFIGVTTLNRFMPSPTIYSDFKTLEDAIDCCIASSHIPMITGGMINKYNNIYSFDGGFCKYPYLNKSKSVLHISPNIWELTKYNDKNINNLYTESQIFDSSLFSKSKYNFDQLFDEGYEDTNKNKKILDILLL